MEAQEKESSMSPPIVGPEYQNTGDPEWIEPVLEHMGAFPMDHYRSSGRWRERIPPTGTHPLDTDIKAVCRIGFEKALGRLNEALRQIDGSAAQDLKLRPKIRRFARRLRCTTRSNGCTASTNTSGRTSASTGAQPSSTPPLGPS